MRYLLAAAALAASVMLVPAPARADSPVRLPQLAPGEVLLEVDGIGIIRTPATTATVTKTVIGYGATQSQAQRRLVAEVERVSALARAAGASPDDITVEPVAITNELRMFDVADRLEAASENSDEQRTAEMASMVTIRLRNPERAAELHNRLNAGNFSYLNMPVYEIADVAAARRAARAAAIADARADAETYAAALGMRIVRTLRVTERAGMDFASLLFTEAAAAAHVSRIGPRFSAAAERAEVETAAVVGIDFVLAPR